MCLPVLCVGTEGVEPMYIVAKQMVKQISSESPEGKHRAKELQYLLLNLGVFLEI